MRITTGKVVEGNIVPEDDPPEDGSTVTVLAPEGDQTFELSASLAQADRGKMIEGAELLREIRKRS